MASQLNRLHLATRIHLGLLRLLGEGVDVGRMLRQRDYADEVLHVCRGLGEHAIVELADRFDDATAEESARTCLAEASRAARQALAQIPRRAPLSAQDLSWSDHTSGFGLTRALETLDDAPPPPPRRSGLAAWFGTARRAH